METHHVHELEVSGFLRCRCSLNRSIVTVKIPGVFFCVFFFENIEKPGGRSGGWALGRAPSRTEGAALGGLAAAGRGDPERLAADGHISPGRRGQCHPCMAVTGHLCVLQEGRGGPHVHNRTTGSGELQQVQENPGHHLGASRGTCIQVSDPPRREPCWLGHGL